MQAAITGAVQGIGFRPFLCRLARELGLRGHVINTAAGVAVDVEGRSAAVEEFFARLETEKPPLSHIEGIHRTMAVPEGRRGFVIRESAGAGAKTALVLPDIATCAECVRELFDPGDRRYRYPFINCTHCGPRFSIIESIPYDRPNTSMKRFAMCGACRAEYEDEADRRFHAQPIACPECGPRLEWWDARGKTLATRDEALPRAVEAVRAGEIVALKGLGGFHLIVDARNIEAVRRLRRRKHREEKPFAIMFPSLESIEAHCLVSELEVRLLRSPEAPIVLLNRQISAPDWTREAAPGSPALGAMLPYTPLHHLLLHDLGFPIIATSGNLSDEPICIDEREALHRLRGIADGFLVHDRPIVRHVDDSIVRVVHGREMVLRRARGYAPLPIRCTDALDGVLAVGAHLKNTVAIAKRGQVFISQHIGDLETAQACDAFSRAIDDVQRLFDVTPTRVMCDLHPDYHSTRFARAAELPAAHVQHHYAHVLSCMAEHNLDGAVLGVSWDGTGYGPDGAVWGGEFLVATRGSYRRVASFRPFPLPGGDAAVKEPRRCGLAVLHETFGDELAQLGPLPALETFTAGERAALIRMMTHAVRSPRTSSAGRLFDAVASILGLCQRATFEGQAAMALEALVGAQNEARVSYRFAFESRTGFEEIDWRPVIRQIVHDLRNGVAREEMAAAFHDALAEAVVEIARRARRGKLSDVVLTGGCFQNAVLSERCIGRLLACGFQPHWHRRVPPNDGGIALGQIFCAAATGPPRADG